MGIEVEIVNLINLFIVCLCGFLACEEAAKYSCWCLISYPDSHVSLSLDVVPPRIDKVAAIPIYQFPIAWMTCEEAPIH